MKVKVCVLGTREPNERNVGGREWVCQVICARALDYLQRTKESSEFPQFYGYKNVTGVFFADNAAAKALNKFIVHHPKLREYGMTAAMHHIGVLHAMKIFELGREEYLRQLAECREPQEFFEFEWGDAFPVDVSK